MSRFLPVLVLFASVTPLLAQVDHPIEQISFRPAEVLSAADIPVPTGCIALGTVVVDALITETGEVEKVEVRRDIPCLTMVVDRAVRAMTFSPATVAGKAVPSRISVALTQRPMSRLAAEVPLPPLIPESEAAIQAAFQSAQVVRATFPNYPDDTVAMGTAVLEVALSATGKAGEIKVLHNIPRLTEEAKAAVANWRFMPATFNGAPVRSMLLIAFVFPGVANPY